MPVKLENGDKGVFRLEATDARQIILSVGQGVDVGHSYHFTPSGSWVERNDGEYIDLHREGNLFYMKLRHQLQAAAAE